MIATATSSDRVAHSPDRLATKPEPIPIVFYEGKRIYFRPLELADESLLRRWINDPANWRGLGTRGPLNGCREREWIEQQGKSLGGVVRGRQVVARFTRRYLYRPRTYNQLSLRFARSG